MEALAAPDSQSGEVELRVIWVVGSNVVFRLGLNKKGQPVFFLQCDLVEVIGRLGATVDVGKPVISVYVVFNLLNAALAGGGKEVEHVLHSFASKHGFYICVINIVEMGY